MKISKGKVRIRKDSKALNTSEIKTFEMRFRAIMIEKNPENCFKNKRQTPSP